MIRDFCLIREDFKRCVRKSLACLLVLVALVGCNDSPAPPVVSSPSLTESAIQGTATWLADNVITFGETGGDTPLVAGKYVFWKSWNASANTWTLQAREVSAQSGFTLTDKLDVSSFMASDGKTAVWRGSEPGLVSVHLYDLAARTDITLREASGQSDLAAYELAIDGDLLYYTNGNGLHLRDMRTNHERLISANGKKPIAANGMLLWVEAVAQVVKPTATSRGETPAVEENHVGRPPTSPGRYWELHLLQPGETGRGAVLTTNIAATGSLAFDVPCSYNLGGDYVVWTGEYGDHITAYNVKSHKIEIIPTNPQPYLGTLCPLVSGNAVVWIEETTREPGQLSVQAYDPGTRMLSTIASFRAGGVQAWGVVENEALIYTLDGSLYSMPLDR